MSLICGRDYVDTPLSLASGPQFALSRKGAAFSARVQRELNANRVAVARAAPIGANATADQLDCNDQSAVMCVSLIEVDTGTKKWSGVFGRVGRRGGRGARAEKPYYESIASI